MFSNLQVPFLQALGYAIANSLWQIFLLWLLVVLVNGMAKQSPVIKYLTAVAAQAGGFVWFISTLQFYYQHCVAVSSQEAQFLLQPDMVSAQPFFVKAGVISYLFSAEQMLPYLSVAYLFLLLLFLTRWLVAFRVIRQLSVSGLQPANAGWQRFVNETADRLQIIQSVSVYLSSLARSPMTIGYIKPMILIPLASVNQLTTEQMEAVLLHELAHIKRSDYLLNIMMSVVEIVLFFNPFTRLLSQQIKTEREKCCDDWVLQSNYNAAMYAGALLRIASYETNSATSLQMNAASHKKGELLQRVKRMIQPEKKFHYKHQIVALFLLTGLLFSIAWLKPSQNHFSNQAIHNNTEITKKIMVAPHVAKAYNPFFNIATFLNSSLQANAAKPFAKAESEEPDSLLKNSVQQAVETLSQLVSQAVTSASSANRQKQISDDNNEATDSLETLDAKGSRKNEFLFADSILSGNNVNVLIDNAGSENVAREAEKSALNELINLTNTKLNVRIGSNLLQQLSGNALAALQQIDFNAIGDSITAASQTLQSLGRKQKWQTEDFEKKQREWIKKVGLNFKKTNNEKTLVLPLMPPPPPPIETPQTGNADEQNATTISYFTPDVQMPNIFSQPVFIASNHSFDCNTKTIRIISNNDSNSVHLIIEIRQ